MLDLTAPGGVILVVLTLGVLMKHICQLQGESSKPFLLLGATPKGLQWAMAWPGWMAMSVAQARGGAFLPGTGYEWDWKRPYSQPGAPSALLVSTDQQPWHSEAPGVEGSFLESPGGDAKISPQEPLDANIVQPPLPSALASSLNGEE